MNKAIEDGSFFENPALRGAFERGQERPPARPRLPRRRPLAHRPPEGAARVRAGEDMDPRVHRRARRLAALGDPRPRRAAHRSDRDRRGPLLRDGSRQPLGSDTESARSRDAPVVSTPKGGDPLTEVQRSYDAGVTDEFIEPTIIEGRPRLDPGPTPRSSSTSGPDRGRQLAREARRARVDLTTMTRYRDDFRSPSRSRSISSMGRSPRC